MNDLNTKFQIHHIIPIEVYSIFSIEFEAIFEEQILQSYNNRIALFESTDMATVYKNMQASDNSLADISFGSSNHNGGHSNYNTAVKSFVIDILDYDLTYEQKKIALIDLQATLKEGLISGELSLYDTAANIKAYIDQHTISEEQLKISTDERYQQALNYVSEYQQNDINHADVTSDKITQDISGKISSANNDLFVKDIGKMFAEKALSSDIPLTNQMRIELEQVLNGKMEVTSNVRSAISHYIKAQAYIDGFIPDPPSTKYGLMWEHASSFNETNQIIQTLTQSLENINLTEDERGTIQTEITKLQAENIIHLQEYNRIAALPDLPTTIPYRNSQSGFIDFQPIYEALSNNTVHSDIKEIIKNNVLQIVDGEIKLNPHVMEDFGKYVSDHLFGGKVGATVMAADFLNNTFDGLIQGIETGYWTNFQQQTMLYGPQAVIGTILFAAGTELVPAIAGLLGVPVVGEIVVGGLLLWGAYEGGKAVGEFLYKLYDYSTEHHINWSQGVENVLKGFDHLFTGLFDKVAEFFNQAQALFRNDPLTLDLDHDGLETTAPSTQHPIMFDHTGSGIKTSSGWILPDDGFLVLDRNGNGKIDNGTELFGDSTPLSSGGTATDGFAALAYEDTNHDGKVDRLDTHWSQLKVWRDLNLDGISQPNELFSLSDLNIAGFNVTKSSNSQVLANGNEIADLGSYYKTDGSHELLGEVSHMADINLVNDTFHSEFSNSISVSADVEQLPNILGSGKLRDLHEAMMLSDTLKALVIQFTQVNDYLTQRAMIPQIIDAWMATDTNYQTIEQRAATEGATVFWYRVDKFKFFNHYTDKDTQGQPIFDQLWQDKVSEWEYKLRVLEEFNGRYYFKLPSEIASGQAAIDGVDDWSYTVENQLYKKYALTLADNHIELLQRSYEQIVHGIQNSLLLQSKFQPLLDLITINIESSGHITFNYQSLDDYFSQQISNHFISGMTELFDFNSTISSMLNDNYWQGWQLFYTSLQQHGVDATTQQLLDRLGIYTSIDKLNTDDHPSEFLIGFFSEDDNLIQLNDQYGVIFTNGGNDTVYGGEQGNLINGGDGNDNITGGRGNDILIGGLGDDHLDGGSGINTYVFNRGDGHDQISDKFSYDPNLVRENHIQLNISPEDVQITRSGEELHIYIDGNNELSSDDIQIMTAFASNWGLKTITFADQTVWDLETIKSRVLLGTDHNDYIIGFDNRDNKITGYAGDDYLYGGNGNDTLNGGDDSDTLYGEDGNDILIGGAGNDYLYGEDGDDIINGGTGNDHLSGGRGINTFIYNTGDGLDTITREWITSAPLPQNHILLDVNPAQVELARQYDDQLIIILKPGIDELTIEDVFNSDSRTLSDIRFADNTIWNIEQIKSQVLIGNTQNNHLVGFNNRDDVILAGDGNDLLNGLSGNDLLDGGNGNDALNGGDGNDSLIAGAGDDHLYGGDGNDTLNGGDDSDTLYGEDGNDSLIGGAGNDYLYGEDGDDIINGGTGNDHLSGGRGINTFIYNTGDGLDTITREWITSALLPQNHILLDVNPAQVELARQYDDQLIIILKSGIDELTIENVFNSDSRTLSDIRFADNTIWNIEQIKSQVLIGNTQNNHLVGFNNRDDVILAGDDNDLLNGLSGNDLLDGGNGNDTLNGDDGNDSLIAGAGDDYLYGGDGDDILNGGDDSDTLYGEDGNDILIGGAGNDYLDGGDGDDIINGGTGNDHLKGGFGSDIFTFGTALDTFNNVDTIQDFNPTEDSIQLLNSIFSNFNNNGNINIDNFIAGDGLTGGQDSNDYLVYNANNGNLYYDSDGSGSKASVLFATFTNAPQLTYEQISII